jgi:Cdc6-like AAA superfamily ATPase
MKEEILVTAEVLSHFYTPEKLSYRESELTQLMHNIQNYVSTFVTGPCGSGKTTLAKKALPSFNNSKKSCAYYY